MKNVGGQVRFQLGPDFLLAMPEAIHVLRVISRASERSFSERNTGYLSWQAAYCVPFSL